MDGCGCGPTPFDCPRYAGTKHWDAGVCSRCGQSWPSGTIDPMDFIDTFALRPAQEVVRRFVLKPCRTCDEMADGCTEE